MSEPPAGQRFYREMLLGTLLYSVVLGFFNDYTDVLQTASYSVTFAVAVVLQVLTYLTFALKRRVVALIRTRDGPRQRAATALGVWLVMFLSKFVFLAVIGLLFRDAVTISGFVGLLLVIASMTIAQRLAELADDRLGRRTAGSAA
ncbi:MAG: hypothetical protein L0I24_05755 [Pseudonocardia sp.]|nr:hypothetical protein [Pseudonocardia sp.]